MFKRFIYWLQLYLFKRKVVALLTQVKEIQAGNDWSKYMKEYFINQHNVVTSPFMRTLTSRDLSSGSSYIYGSLSQTRQVFLRALDTITRNKQVEFHLDKEFRQNAVNMPLLLIYEPDISLYEQLLELDILLRQIKAQYEALPEMWKMSNLGRLTTFYELYAVLVTRTLESYLEGLNHE